MIIVLRQQKGLVSGIAIMTMLFFGLCLAGLMPFLSTLEKNNGAKNDVSQAQYAAEAGIKRALVNMGETVNGTTVDWSWLGSDHGMIASTSTAARYNVSIKQETTPGSKIFSVAFSATALQGPPPPTISYQITSVGKFNKAQVILYAIVPVNTTGIDYTAIVWTK